MIKDEKQLETLIENTKRRLKELKESDVKLPVRQLYPNENLKSLEPDEVVLEFYKSKYQNFAGPPWKFVLTTVSVILEVNDYIIKKEIRVREPKDIYYSILLFKSRFEDIKEITLGEIFELVNDEKAYNDFVCCFRVYENGEFVYYDKVSEIEGGLDELKRRKGGSERLIVQLSNRLGQEKKELSRLENKIKEIEDNG